MPPNSLAPGTKRMIQIAVVNESTAISNADILAMPQAFTTNGKLTFSQNLRSWIV